MKEEALHQTKTVHEVAQHIASSAAHTSDAHAHAAHVDPHAAGEAAHEGVKHLANIITYLNDVFHGNPILHALHEWETVFFAFVAGAILVTISFFATRNVKMIPDPLQNAVEAAVEALENMVVGIMGPKGRKYVPFIGTLFFYILLQNYFGMIPGFMAPTSSLSTTAGLAISVFFYVQFIGLKEGGLWGYIHHLMGSPQDGVGWAMVPLNLPLHILEEFIKPMSLALRLFGNILGEDSLIAAFVGLGILSLAVIHSPIGLPLQLPFLMLSMLLGLIQALVFALLTTIYISLILPHEEHEH